MNTKSIVILGLLLIIPLLSTAQKKKISKSLGRVSDSVSRLDEADQLKDKDPILAIEIIEEVIEFERNQKKRRMDLGRAYFTLGKIYEQIDQNDLAFQRYQTALKTSGKDIELGAEIRYRMGVLSLQKRDQKNAEQYFTLCLNITKNKGLRINCIEGLTDLKLMMNQGNAALTDLIELQEKYSLDSTSNARIEARKVQAYMQINDFENASNALLNSVNTLPQNAVLQKSDMNQLEKAKESFFSDSKISNIDKIEIQKNMDYSRTNDDALVRENFRISKLYEEENDPEKAMDYLEESKLNITTNTTSELAAEVYKKSYETNVNLGKIEQALTDLNLYVEARQKTIEQLKNDLSDEIEIVKSQKRIDIAELDYSLVSKDKDLLRSQVFTQKLIIGFLILALLVSSVFFYLLYKNIRAKKKANQLLFLKSLRTQMNPHFIFNALNSVNNFIAKNDERAANKFLGEFSKLMRKVLDYSQKDFIGIHDEIELNELYLKLEHFRFRDKFDYHFENNISQTLALEVPPMLIQPFIENAVWHGLRYKEEKGKLNLIIDENDSHILVTVEDNGIGREKSKKLKTKNQKKYNSTGLSNVAKRIALINELYDQKYEVSTSNLNEENEDAGTSIKIKIPINQ